MSLLLLSSTEAESSSTESIDELVVVALEAEAVFVEGEGKMRTITRRQGDMLPPIQAIAFDDGARADLTQFETITFRMVAGETEIEGAATGDSNGVFTYDLADGDTDTPGTYSAVFECVTADGKTQTFPTASNLTVVVIAGL